MPYDSTSWASLILMNISWASGSLFLSGCLNTQRGQNQKIIYKERNITNTYHQHVNKNAGETFVHKITTLTMNRFLLPRIEVYACEHGLQIRFFSSYMVTDFSISQWRSLKDNFKILTSFVPFSCKLFLCRNDLQSEKHPIFCTGLHRLPENPIEKGNEPKSSKIWLNFSWAKCVPFALAKRRKFNEQSFAFGRSPMRSLFLRGFLLKWVKPLTT